MITWLERNYGADADGNRGVTYREYELDETDFFEVQSQVIEQLNGYDYEDYPETVTITMICPVTEDDIQFEVDVKDYI